MEIIFLQTTHETNLPHQVIKINDYQKNSFTRKIIDGLGGDVKGKKIAILGWAFKKDTNDSRESAAIYVTDILLELGADVHIYDPMVKEERIKQDLSFLWENRNISQSNIKKKLKCCFVHLDHSDALKESFAAAILTEWDEFNNYDWDLIAEKMIQPAKIFDGRNMLIKKNKKLIYSIGK